MTAVIYARYSSDNQREESIEGQIRECNAYAEKNGITVVKHYIDRAISAKTDNRPQFQQMIKDSERKSSLSLGFASRSSAILASSSFFCVSRASSLSLVELVRMPAWMALSIFWMPVSVSRSCFS